MQAYCAKEKILETYNRIAQSISSGKPNEHPTVPPHADVMIALPGKSNA